MERKEGISSYEMSQLFNELYKDNKDANKIVEFVDTYFIYELEKIKFEIEFNFNGDLEEYFSSLEYDLEYDSKFNDSILKIYFNNPNETNLGILRENFILTNFRDILRKIKYSEMNGESYEIFKEKLNITPLMVFQMDLKKIDSTLIEAVGGLAKAINYLYYENQIHNLEITKEMVMKDYNRIPLVKVLNYFFYCNRLEEFTKEELEFLRDNYKRGISVTSQIQFGMIKEEDLLDNLATGVSQRAKKILDKKLEEKEDEFSDAVRLFTKLM